jgi:S-disulfanyl-L-cysteine oxidoreductase SoxD
MTTTSSGKTFLPFLIVVGVLVVAGARDLAGQRTSGPGAPAISEKTVWDGVYTAEQARRGAQFYRQFCSRCHDENLGGKSAGAPPLVGMPFFDRWRDLSVFDLSFGIQSGMPHRDPGIPPPGTVTFLPFATITDIVTFLLQFNGLPDASRELPTDIDTLRQIAITRRPIGR